MAFTSRVTRAVEIVVSLKDKLSASAKKAADSFKNIGTSAKKSFKEVDESASNSAARLDVFKGKLLAIGAALRTFSLVAVSAFSAAGAATVKYAQQLANVGKQADTIGTSVEQLSKLQFAATQTQVRIETLDRGLRIFSTNVARAAQNTGEAQKALVELGVSAEALTKLTLEEQFKRIADAFEGVTNESDRLRLAVRLFGQENTEIVNILTGGSAAIEAYGDKLEELGGVYSDVSAKGAQEFVQSLNTITVKLKSLVKPLGDFFINIGNNIFESTGIAEESVDKLEEKIRKLKATIASGESGATSGLFDAQIAEELIDLLNEYEDALQKIQQAESDVANNKAIQQSLFERNKVFRNADEERIAIEKETQKELDKLRQQELSAQKAAVTQYAKNRKVFDDLVQEVVAPASIDNVNIFDVADQIAKANQALAAGDSQAALETSKKAGELLIELKDKGEVAGLVLQGLAKKIRDLGVEASKEVAVEDITVDFTANTDPVQAAIQELQATQVSVGVVFVPTNNQNDVIYQETLLRGDNG